MTPAIVIAIISLVLSVISTSIAVVSFRRTRTFQSYDYAPRLQLDNETIRGGSGPEAFYYSAELVNAGMKPVEVRAIYIDYGGESEGTYYKFHVEGLFHLPPNGRRNIYFSMSRQDYEGMLGKFNLEQCIFRLRVCFSNTTGGLVETTRKLMGLGPATTTAYAQRGDALT